MKQNKFNEELLKIRQPLLFFALKLTRNQADAEDLLSDTILKILEKQHKFKDQGSEFLSWASVVMKNIFLTKWRQNARKRDFMKTKHPFQYTKGIDITIEQRDQIDFLKERLNNDLDSLLYYAEGFKYKEIAKMMSAPVGTIKTQIHYLRKKAKKLLSQEKIP